MPSSIAEYKLVAIYANQTVYIFLVANTQCAVFFALGRMSRLKVTMAQGQR